MDTLPIKNQLREFLTLSLNDCMQSVKASAGSIFLLEDSKKELILEVARNGKNLRLEGVRKRLGEAVAGLVASQRKPLLVEDIDNEPFLAGRPRYSHYRSKSFLSVPLEFSGSLIGVVNVTEKDKGEPFTYHDLLTMLDVSRYLSIAIYSLRDYLKNQILINENLRKELDTLKKSIKESEKFSSLGKLVGGLVHEINNPLDGIIRYINLALDSTEEDGIVKEYLLEAKRGLNRIVNIVRSLLDFSWSLSSSHSRIDVNRLIDESLFMLSHYLFSYQIEVSKRLTTPLPKLPDYRLKLVFTNIIKNACEAMKDKGGKLSITTGIRDGNILITFSDTGPGIPEDIQERIFEPFFTTKRMGEGSGLGLAICYEIVQRYGGKIRVKSKVGEGTTFTIELPSEREKS